MAADKAARLALRAAAKMGRLGFWLGRRCLACGQSLSGGEGLTGCCSQCAAALQPRLGGYCPLCGSVYAQSGEPPGLCLDCLAAGRPWDGFGFHHVYQGLLRDLILAWKFQGELGYSLLLRELLVSAFERHLHRERFDLVVPVPIHQARLRQRGFNQSLELARSLVRKQRIPLGANALRRWKNTPPQTGLSRRERQSNLRGAFRGSVEQIDGRSVLLVDDIYTTGATVKACAAAIRKAGARRVSVLVLARAMENW